MESISTNTLLDALKWRYATKKFDASKKIPAETWASIEEALVLTASSYGLQPWKFLVIDNPELREKLVEVSWGQRQVADASHFVVFTAKQTITEEDAAKLIGATAAARDVPADGMGFYKEMIVGDLVKGARSAMVPHWAARQAYIALGNLLTSAALLGLDACPMEGLDPAKYDEILGLTASGYATVVACPVGYRASDDKYSSLAKVRYPHGEIIQHIS